MCVCAVHIPIEVNSFYFVIFFKVQYKQQNETDTPYTFSSIINYRDFNQMPYYYTYLSADYTILEVHVGCLSKINILCNHFAEQD